MNLPFGTLFNALTILIGGSIGLALNKNFPQKIKVIVFQAIGLFTLVIGLQMAFKTPNPLILIFSLLIGGILGEASNLEMQIEKISESIKKRFKFKSNTFSEGLITSFLLFCVGSMTIVGSINEGISGDRTLLLTKSILDGFSSLALASSLGVGVIFSVFPLLIFQGGLTMLAGQLQSIFSTLIVEHLTSVGGVLILGISLNLLEINKIRVTNLLPSLFVATLLAWLNMLI